LARVLAVGLAGLDVLDMLSMLPKIQYPSRITFLDGASGGL